MGDISKAIAPHCRVPLNKDKGYLGYHFVGRVHQKSKLSLVATTFKLQERFMRETKNEADRVIHADGGWKFNVSNFPVTVIGETNLAGNYNTGGLALTSSIDEEHVTKVFTGYRESTERVDMRKFSRIYSMSDGDECYRHAFKTTFRVKTTLMCYFHVKSASRKWIYRHCKLDVVKKAQLWARIGADLDVIQASISPKEFESRCTAIESKWRSEKVHLVTRWRDKNGVDRDWIKHFHEQWRQKCSEWLMQENLQIPARIMQRSFVSDTLDKTLVAQSPMLAKQSSSF